MVTHLVGPLATKRSSLSTVGGKLSLFLESVDVNRMQGKQNITVLNLGCKRPGPGSLVFLFSPTVNEAGLSTPANCSQQNQGYIQQIQVTLPSQPFCRWGTPAKTWRIILSSSPKPVASPGWPLKAQEQLTAVNHGQGWGMDVSEEALLWQEMMATLRDQSSSPTGPG